jgi:hypothetical protein
MARQTTSAEASERFAGHGADAEMDRLADRRSFEKIRGPMRLQL